jgi:hypothetical protein
VEAVSVMTARADFCEDGDEAEQPAQNVDRHAAGSPIAAFGSGRLVPNAVIVVPPGRDVNNADPIRKSSLYDAAKSLGKARSIRTHVAERART